MNGKEYERLAAMGWAALIDEINETAAQNNDSNEEEEEEGGKEHD